MPLLNLDYIKYAQRVTNLYQDLGGDYSYKISAKTCRESVLNSFLSLWVLRSGKTTSGGHLVKKCFESSVTALYSPILLS